MLFKSEKFVYFIVEILKTNFKQNSSVVKPMKLLKQ